MKKFGMPTAWALLFILCAGLGFIPAPDGALKTLMTLLSLAFFVPPFCMLRSADQKQDLYTATLIRNLAALSLGLTMVLLIVNFLSVTASSFVGDLLYYVLVIVSSPMVCSGYWVLSLFGWACLLTVSRNIRKKLKM